MLNEQVLILPRSNDPVKMDKRELILDAAERVLRAKGLSGATTRAITTEAGCAEGTLYLYFKGRAEVFLALFHRHLIEPFQSLERSLGRSSGDDEPHTVLLDVGLQFLRFYREMSPLLAGLFAEPALLKNYRELVLRSPEPARAAPALTAYLRQRQRAKRISNRIDPATAAEVFLGACFSRAFLDNMLDDRSSEAADRKFLRTLIRTLVD